jgi:hypothetical protein
MVKFVFPSGREGWINGVRGKIIGSKVWTETHVSSSGGGGYLHNGTGQVHAPTVHSTIIEKGETWVKTKNGKDVCIPAKITGIEGHDVLVLWGNLNEIDSKTGPHLYWKNFSADKHSYIGVHDRRMFLSKKDSFNGSPTFFVVLIVCMVVGAIIALPNDSSDGFSAMVGGGVCGFIIGYFVARVAVLVARMFHKSTETTIIEPRANKLLKDLEQLSMRDDLEFNG